MDGRLKLRIESLKNLRRNKGLSQEALAKDILNRGYTVSLATLKRAETGKSVLYRTANNISLYYKVPLPELIEVANDSNTTHSSIELAIAQ